MLVLGLVTLNGAVAVSGMTIFSDSRIKTARNGSATINLGKLGRLELGPETELALRFSEATIAGNLLSGRVIVNAPAGVEISIVTADGVAAADGRQSSGLVVDVTCGNTRVAVSRSEATVTAGERVEHVTLGQELTLGTPALMTSFRCPPLKAVTRAGGWSLVASPLGALLAASFEGVVAGIALTERFDKKRPGTLILSGEQVSPTTP